MDIVTIYRQQSLRENAIQMFVELFDLSQKNDVIEWTASARWIKYEEDTEGVDNHWSRPHVSYLRVKSFVKLKNVLSKGVLLLDPPNVTSLEQIIRLIATQMMRKFDMDLTQADKVASLLAHSKIRKFEHKAHTFQRKTSSTAELNHHGFEKKVHSFHIDHNANDRRSSFKGQLPDLHEDANGEGTPASTAVSSPSHGKNMKRMFSFRRLSLSGNGSSEFDHHLQAMFDSDVMQLAEIFVAENPEFIELRLVGIRLAKGQQIPEFLRSAGKIRFVFLLFGPPSSNFENHDVGRALGTLLTNKQFLHLATAALSKAPLLKAIESFLDDTIIVPQLEIDQQDLLNVDDHRNFVAKRRGIFRNNSSLSLDPKNLPEEKMQEKLQLDYPIVKPKPHPFERTGTPFGGVVNDLKQRIPYYFDDFRQALNFQCFTSIMYIFFANFASAVAIGDVLGKKTGDWMGVSEMLVSHALAGIVWGLFAGQPLCIVAAVGPFMVLEDSLYQFCDSLGADFLATRFWTGLWSFVFMVILAMIEAPFLMRYLTRFTEDIFTGLIAFIFVWEAGKFILLEFWKHPVRDIDSYCPQLNGNGNNYTVER